MLICIFSVSRFTDPSSVLMDMYCIYTHTYKFAVKITSNGRSWGGVTGDREVTVMVSKSHSVLMRNERLIVFNHLGANCRTRS